MKSSPGPVAFFPRNPIIATLVVAVAALALQAPKKVQLAVLATIKALRT